MYRQEYFLVSDEITNELLRRFDQNDLNIVIDVENLLLKNANNNQVDVSESVIETYGKDLNFEKIQLQLKMIPNLILRHKEITGNTIKKVTNLRTLCEIFNSNPVVKKMCPEMHMLLKLYMTVPVTTATAERTFSVMRRIKTYFRSSMSQQRLNHSLLLHCYQERVDSLDIQDIAKSFILANDRRQLYFGQSRSYISYCVAVHVHICI